MNKYFKIAALFVAAAISVANAAAQEWETKEKYSFYNDDSILCYEEECLELTNGNILVGSTFYYRSGAGDFYSEQPAVVLLSSDGKEIARNSYFRPGLCTVSFSPFLFEKDGEMYILTTYSPDHDSTYFNYFGDYDNPPTDAILCLYKLDENLNVSERYEQISPIDVYEDRDKSNWRQTPNYYSGHIFLFSAFEDEGNITGAYFKTVSNSDVPRGQDSLFFFKMDFEGNFLLKKGYEMPVSGGGEHAVYSRQHIVKADNGYIMYTRGLTIEYHGEIQYYDNEFNHITTKYILQPGLNAHPDLQRFKLEKVSVVRSNRNTTYLSTSVQTPDGQVRLYEIDDDINNSGDTILVVDYIERRSNNRDWAARVGVDMTDDEKIYFAYTLNTGISHEFDSWMVIELLDTNLDTVSTVYYNNQGVHDMLYTINATNDGGVLLVLYSENLYDIDKQWTTVAKFPPSVFGIDNIEEAHAHGLHLAVAYPNPGGDVMNIRTGLRNAVLSVYDIQGRKIHEQEITDDVTSVDASKWQSGTYIWKLGMRNEELGMKEVETGKWVK